jgi:hypothetical protein
MVVCLARHHKPGASKKRKRFFFEKKKQKTFAPAGVGTAVAIAPSKSKFFASFFQKRSARLLK